MFCRRCGARLPADGLFCTNCGTRNETQGEQNQREQATTSKLVREQYIAPIPPDNHENGKSNRGLAVALLCVLLAIFVISIGLLVVLLKDGTDETDMDVTSENAVQTVAKEEEPTRLEASAPTEPVTERATEPETERVTEPETTEVLQSSGGSFGEYVYYGDYLIVGSDSRYITEDDISWMTERDMQMAINEIYARNGRIFNSPEIRAYFESKSWYRGSILPDDFTEGILNEYEKANIAFLLEHQHG